MADVSLEDFVFETLLSISKGVARAQDESKRSGGIPIALNRIEEKLVEQGEQLVSFSVSVQANGTKGTSVETDAKANIISVVTGRVGAEGHVEKSDSRLHTIDFSVPMYFNSRWSKVEQC
ncbi:hypothetical protein I5535_07710 [Rhodobacteraceae bacterium F11138]|nr:hypothetical protein [Rhodobacteraceae bacterium F11138]